MSNQFGHFYGYVYTVTNIESGDVYVGRSTNTNDVDADFGDSPSLNDDINSLGQGRFSKRMMGFANDEVELKKMWNKFFIQLTPYYNSEDGDKELPTRPEKKEPTEEAGIKNKDTLDKSLKGESVKPTKKVAKKRTRRTKSKIVEELEQLRKDM